MAKLPRDVTGARFIRVLGRAGFSRMPTTGPHPVYKHPNGRRVPVSVHGSDRIGPGLLRRMLAQAGLSLEQFIALL